MKTIDQLATVLLNTWAKKPLEELRLQAEHEKSGIALDALRLGTGQRLIIVLCATDIDQIARLEKVLEFVDDGASEDWTTFTVAHMAMRLMRNGGGLRFESLKDEYGRRSALALVAADPASVRAIETLFQMPD
ncbi:MAG TPA: hypothetical protein VG167_04030 [Verrucomicrobiae bacterium]|nr:hypothetical protein [Verrucomicrobiae bacterium]